MAVYSLLLQHHDHTPLEIFIFFILGPLLQNLKISQILSMHTHTVGVRIVGSYKIVTVSTVMSVGFNNHHA